MTADHAAHPHDLPRTSAPASRALAAAGVSTLDQLANRTAKEIAALHGMGPKAMRILTEALDDAGLAFAAPDD